MKAPILLMRAVVLAAMAAASCAHAEPQQLPRYEIVPLLTVHDNVETRTALRIDRVLGKVQLCRVTTTSPNHAPLRTGGCADTGLANFYGNVSRSSYAATPIVVPPGDSTWTSVWSVNVDTGAVQFCEFGGPVASSCLPLTIAP